MEKLVRIIEQKAHVTRKYQKNGNDMTFDSMGFILTDGIDTFYAEMIGDKSRTQQPLDVNIAHTVQCHMGIREWEDANGEKRYENRVTIDRIV